MSPRSMEDPNSCCAATLPSDVTGKRPGWWQLGMDVDKKPLDPEEVQAVTPSAEQVDVAIALNLVYGTGARSGQFKKKAS